MIARQRVPKKCRPLNYDEYFVMVYSNLLHNEILNISDENVKTFMFQMKMLKRTSFTAI